MATSGMLLKGAKGKLGDIVATKGPYGSTVLRQRVTPKNPKTSAQMVQRAITATIGKAYNAGKAIFDHSFEGKTTGRASMDYFRKMNANALRAAVNSDLANSTADESALGACVAKNATAPIPWSYLISTGSLYQALFSIVPSTQQIGVQLVEPTTNETVAQYAARLGLVAGDIYTVCAFGYYSTAFTGAYNMAPDQCSFGFVRFIVKDGLASVDTPMSTATLQQLFTVDQSGVLDSQIPASLATAVIDISSIIGHTIGGCMGVIRSREDSRQRSTSRMYFINDGAESLVPVTGIKSAYVADAWVNGANEPGSSLILEGGNF